MTTFTMQDLTPNDTPTPEEDEAFNALEKAIENRKVFENIQPATKEDFMQGTITDERAEQIIHGATGAQYTPIDVKQFEGHLGTGKADAVANASMQHLFITLTSTIQAIIKLSLEQEQQKRPVSSSSADLQGAVDVVLNQAEWFKVMVEKAVDDRDFDELVSEAVADKVDSEVEHYFNYNFSLEDHVDVADLVSDAVDDRLEDIVNEKLDEILEDALKEKLANITISFN